MAKHTLVAVDLAKSVFEVAVSHHPGQVAEQKRYSREQFPRALAQLSEATVVMEACGSAHYLARRVKALGHEPVLLPRHAVRPYVRRNKTDRTDTKGMLDAYLNEEIRPVPVKTIAQQTLASLHRLRSGWLAERTARINTLRGLLREFGILIPLGAQHENKDAPRQGRVIRLAPCARTPLMAGSTLPLHSEAGDTTAVRPSSRLRPLRSRPPSVLMLQTHFRS